MYLIKGSLNTNGKAVTIGNFVATTSNTKQLTLGSSMVTLTIPNSSVNAWDASGAGTTINPGTSLIKFTGTGAQSGLLPLSGQIYYDVIFQTEVYNVIVPPLNLNLESHSLDLTNENQITISPKRKIPCANRDT